MEAISHTDRDLLRDWLKGRESAFNELVNRHGGLVFGVAVRQTGDRSVAEEVVQDVFATLARKARIVLGHPSLPAWLHVTSRNMARRARAKMTAHKRKMGRLKDELAEDAPGLTAAPEARIDGAIARLPVREREVIVLRFFEDCDYSEISRRLSVTEAAARKRVSRGLRRLEKSLQQDMAGGARLASLSLVVPASLATSIISSSGKAGAATAGAAGTLTTLIGIITMNTITKCSLLAVAGVGLTWFGIANYSKRVALQEQLDDANALVTRTPTVPTPEPGRDATPLEIAELQTQLDAVTEERDRLSDELAALNEAVGDLNEEVVVNLGRIQDLGSEYANLMVEAKAMVAQFDAEGGVDPQQRKELMQEFMERAGEITAAVPEIIGFEERPKDITRFFKALFQNLVGIDEAEAETLGPILERYYVEAIENEVTMKHAPQMDPDKFDAWKAGRDAFFADGRAEVLEAIPEDHRELFEQRIDDDSFWPRDMTVGGLPLVFNPAGDRAAKVYRQLEKLTRGKQDETGD